MIISTKINQKQKEKIKLLNTQIDPEAKSFTTIKKKKIKKEKHFHNSNTQKLKTTK